ncbi:EF-hand calcium-binding domain-containing protein 11 [Chytriomyces hyalinus]|nr:EF-hand calcium-binding domain-containing protein 11 [Chytriomyces hyalinus]
MLRSIPNRLESHPMKARIIANIREVFRRADVERRGSLTMHGLKVGFVGLLGFEPSNFEIEQISKKFNIERGELNEDAFVELMGPKVAASDVDEIIRAMFVALDVDGSGFITLHAFKRAVAIAAPHVSAAVAEDFFAEADGDRDARVAYREFCSLIKRAI